MEWSDISDPNQAFVFSQNAWTVIQGSWFPEDIQKMIEEKGVENMVHEVNRVFSQELRRPKPIKLGRINGQNIVLAMDE